MYLTAVIVCGYSGQLSRLGGSQLEGFTRDYDHREQLLFIMKYIILLACDFDAWNVAGVDSSSMCGLLYLVCVSQTRDFHRLLDGH